MTEVVLVTCDNDWQALYIDNVSELQGHTVEADDALERVALMRRPFTFRYLYQPEFAYLERNGCFPPYLHELEDEL